MHARGWQLGLIALIITVTTAACGVKEVEDAKSQGAAPSAAPTASATASPTPNPTPAAVKVDEKKVEELLAQFPSSPGKVVTVSVAIAEILDKLGVTPVGVPTTSSKLPEAFAKLSQVGSSHQLNLEQIAKLQPDVILGPSSIKDSLEKALTPTKIKTAYIPVDSLDELKTSTVALSRVFKQEAKATAFLQQFAKDEAAALEQAKGQKAPKVLFLFGSAESLMFMNENTFAGSLAKNLGASNVVSDVLKLKDTYAPLNMESIVAANPDIILVVAHGDPAAAAKKFEEDVKKNGAWEKLNAFKNNKLKTLDYNLFGIASIVNGPAAYKELAQVLYSN